MVIFALFAMKMGKRCFFFNFTFYNHILKKCYLLICHYFPTFAPVILIKMLTKEYIKEIKHNSQADLEQLIQSNIHNSGNLTFILENLGKLPISYNPNWLLPLLDYDNEQVRFWVVKNLGKLKSENVLVYLEKVAKTDQSTLVKREAISSMGRLRDEKTQKHFLVFNL